MDNIALDFINKSIQKTKSDQLHWSSMKGQSTLLRTRPDNVDDIYDEYTLSSFPPVNLIDLDCSYYAQFKNGYIFLLSVSRDFSDPKIANPIDSTFRFLSLRIQNDSVLYAKEIANSDYSNELSIQLKRLYSLAENSASNLDGFINDFLNS